MMSEYIVEKWERMRGRMMHVLWEEANLKKQWSGGGGVGVSRWGVTNRLVWVA